MPAYCVGLAKGVYGDLTGARAVVLGASYRGGVKETAFSGVFPTVELLRQRGAVVTVHDPMFTVAELEAMGFDVHDLGNPVDAVIVQADHQEYSRLSPEQFPGVRVLVDGRDITNSETWRSVRRLVIGRPQWANREISLAAPSRIPGLDEVAVARTRR